MKSPQQQRFSMLLIQRSQVPTLPQIILVPDIDSTPLIGLSGIDLGHLLIKRVVYELQKELPSTLQDPIQFLFGFTY